MRTIGYPHPLFLFALGDGGDRVPSAEPRAIVWEAIDRTAERCGLDPTEIGVLVDDSDADALAEAGERGYVRAVSVGGQGRAPFELAPGEGFARQLEGSGASIAKVALSWNPGHPPDDKKAQAMQLAKLAAWLHETDRKLLVDLEVPPVDTDLEQVGQDTDRFQLELQPALVRRSVQEIRELGAEPDLWITPATGSEPDATELAELVGEAGREEVALLLADDADEPALRTAAELTGYRGFVAGRTILAEALASFDAGRSSRDETIRSIEGAFGRRLERFRPATRGR